MVLVAVYEMLHETSKTVNFPISFIFRFKCLVCYSLTESRSVLDGTFITKMLLLCIPTQAERMKTFGPDLLHDL